MTKLLTLLGVVGMAVAATAQTAQFPNINVRANSTIAGMEAVGNTVITNTLQVGPTRTNVFGNRAVVAAGSTPRNAFFAATTDLAEGTTGSMVAIGPAAATGNTYGEVRALDQGGNSTADLILQLGSGNLGVGTSTTSAKLTVAGDAVITNTAAGTTPLSVYQPTLTGAESNSIANLSTTWNTTGNPSALKLVITDTASGSTAKAIEVLGGAAGTTALLSVTKTGTLTTAGSIASGGQVSIDSSRALSWGDVLLYRDGAANTLALRNGANAQAFRVYNTYTDSSNWELLGVAWSGNRAFITAERAGTGIARELVIGTGSTTAMYLRTAGTDRWSVNASGHLLAVTDNTYDIGASGATRPRNVYVGTGVIAGGGITAGNTGGFSTGRMSLDTTEADGVVRLSNVGETDFNRLQFGGITASFPSLKRSTTNLVARLADDSSDTDFQASHFIVSGTTNQILFGSTNTAPVSAVAPTKWISVQVAGESAVYRMPLYE